LRCLQKRPQARYDNLAALLDELEQRVPTARSQRSRPGASLLADLALPTPHAGAKGLGFRYWPVLALALAFLSGFAVVIGLKRGFARKGGGSPTAQAPPGLTSGASPGRPSSAATAVVRVTEVPSAANAAVTHSPASSALQPPLPARKPTPAGQARTAAPAQKVPAMSGKRHLGGGEIVDPWGDRTAD
jgi:hypothetical protein